MIHTVLNFLISLLEAVRVFPTQDRHQVKLLGDRVYIFKILARYGQTVLQFFFHPELVEYSIRVEPFMTHISGDA